MNYNVLIVTSLEWWSVGKGNHPNMGLAPAIFRLIQCRRLRTPSVFGNISRWVRRVGNPVHPTVMEKSFSEILPIPSGRLTVCYWKWHLSSWFTYYRCWFLIAILVDQRVFLYIFIEFCWTLQQSNIAMGHSFNVNPGLINPRLFNWGSTISVAIKITIWGNHHN